LDKCSGYKLFIVYVLQRFSPIYSLSFLFLLENRSVFRDQMFVVLMKSNLAIIVFYGSVSFNFLLVILCPALLDQSI
jgi:hypothetical protein